MALITCPECGAQMSDKASGCPQCGYIGHETPSNEQTSSYKAKPSIFLGILRWAILAYSVVGIINTLAWYIFVGGMADDKLILHHSATMLAMILISIGMLFFPRKAVCCAIIGFLLQAFLNLKGISAYTDFYEQYNPQSTSQTESPIFDEGQFLTIEDVKKNIDGTVWTYTEPSEEGPAWWYKLDFRNGKVRFYSALAQEGEWGEGTKYDYTIEEKRYSNTGDRFVGIYLNNSYNFVPSTQILYYSDYADRRKHYYMSRGDVNPWK